MNEGSLITIHLVARPPLWLSGSHLLCLFTCKSVVNNYYFDAVLSISARNVSDYSGWMPSQIKIELRRRGARASGQKADLVQNSSVRRDAGSKCNSRCVDMTDFFAHQRANP